MKKTIVLFLIFLLCSIVYTRAQEKIEVNGIFYYLNAPNAIVTSSGTHLNDKITCEGDIVIPASIVYKDKIYQVTSIGEGAFMHYANMTSITIPNTVTTIGGWAFGYCTELNSVILPSSVRNIDPTAFSMCDNLTEIDVDPENQFYNSFYECLATKDNATLVIYPKGMTGYQSIPKGVKVIGRESFATCETSSVNLPNTVTTIEDGAFINSSLNSIMIPSSVTKMGEGIFMGCELKEIYMEAGNPPACSEKTFDGVEMSKCKLYIPAGSMALYKAAKGWRGFILMEE